MAQANAARIAALEATVEQLKLELHRPANAAMWQKNAATVYINGVPRFTAFTHSEAYRCMVAAREAGLKSMYRPLRLH